MMAQSYRKIEAVTKTLEILEFLAKQREPVSGPEVARAVGLPVGTVMCHLATLEEKNFTRRIGNSVELGMGAAIVWAKKKSLLEGQRDLISRDIRALEEGAHV